MSSALVRMKSVARRVLPSLLTVAAILLFWEFFGAITGEPAYIVPPLSDVIWTAVSRAQDKLLPAAFVTLQEVLLGFFIGSVLGFAIGGAIFLSRTVRQAILPLVISTQAIPVLAIAPILVIWFGFGIVPKVIVAALVVFFPVTVTTIAGLNAADPEMVRLVRSFGGTGWQVFWRIRFPAALPTIFAGLKNAAAISAIGALVGEWVGSSEGLGPVMIEANAGFRSAVTFAAILYLAAIAVGLFGLVAIVERLTIPWAFIGKK